MRTTTANKQLLYLDVPQRLLRRPFPRIARRFGRGLTQRHRSARVEPARVDDGEEGEGVRVRGHAAAALGHDAAAGRRAVQHRVRKAVVESAAEGVRVVGGRGVHDHERRSEAVPELLVTLVGWLDSFVRSFIRSFVRSFVPSFVRSFVRSFVSR